jgi:hypothetical protein
VLRIFNIQMGGEHIGKTANLATAHGIRLAGDRERSHTLPANAACGKVAVDDSIDLVCTR